MTPRRRKSPRTRSSGRGKGKKGGASRRRRGRKGRGGWVRRLVRSGLLLLGGLLAVGMVGGYLAWTTCGLRGCPDPGALVGYRAQEVPILLDRRGEPFAQLHPLRLQVVSLESLPSHVPDAFVAVEDRRFREHEGVDWRRVAGAALANVQAGGIREGASTISMQLARTLFPDRIARGERTWRRKLLELRVAGLLEETYSKNEILELYLNHVYIGGGAYGVEAGSRLFFGVPAAELDPGEAALLAGLLRNPSRYDPRRAPDTARERRDLVLSLMEAQGRLSPEVAEGARAEAVAVAAAGSGAPVEGDAPFLVEMVRRALEEEMGEALYHRPLRIHTTLDRRLQTRAEAELTRTLEWVEGGGVGAFRGPSFPALDMESGRTRHLEGAVVFLDPVTGDVLALAGGRDFRTSAYNRAVQGRREMGSVFKPFVFAHALAAGTATSQPLADRPLTLTQAGADPWTPRNHDGGFRGTVGMREALADSRNVPTARLALATGLDPLARLASRAGMGGSLPVVPALSLGVGTASPLEVATAYAVLAAGGHRPEPRWIVRVEDGEGEVIYQAPSTREEVLDPRVAYLVTDMLRTAVDGGTGRGVRTAGYGGPVAGKTGTTQGTRDIWFVGYTPEVVGAVWVGFDDPRPIAAGASGGSVGAPLWGRIAAGAVLGGGGAWPRPAGIVEGLVDPATGQLVGDRCPAPEGGGVRELFLAEYVPDSVCPEGRGFRERVTGFFRRLRSGGGEDRNPGTPTGTEADGADRLTPGDSRERLLGAPPVSVNGSE